MKEPKTKVETYRGRCPTCDKIHVALMKQGNESPTLVAPMAFIAWCQCGKGKNRDVSMVLTKTDYK